MSVPLKCRRRPGYIATGTQSPCPQCIATVFEQHITMMKIAIAGTNGLAQFIAYYLSQITSHSFVFLTRTPNPGLKERGWQVLVVNYENLTSLIYTLKGIDVVISTITGEPQIALVEAAANAQVRHFIPSAFSGPEQCSPQTLGRSDWNDLIAALDKHQDKFSMNYTVFTCGAFYERFAPGGLNALQISTFNNRHAAIGEEGNFLVDIRAGTATIPIISAVEEASVCMISARDVARYIVAALKAFENMASWPKEFRFCTERLTMSQLLEICSRVRGIPIIPTFITPSSLYHAYNAAESINDNKALSLSQYIAVAEAHPAISFPPSTINLTPDILTIALTAGTEPAPSEPFEEWLNRAWSTPSPAPPSSTNSASANTSGKTSDKSSRSGSSQKSKRPTTK